MPLEQRITYSRSRFWWTSHFTYTSRSFETTTSKQMAHLPSFQMICPPKISVRTVELMVGKRQPMTNKLIFYTLSMKQTKCTQIVSLYCRPWVFFSFNLWWWTFFDRFLAFILSEIGFRKRDNSSNFQFHAYFF